MRSLALVLLALASCGGDLSVPGGAHVTCGASAECPSGWRCRTDLGFCVVEGSPDHTPPMLALPPEWVTSAGSVGDVLVLVLESSEPLAVPPVARLGLTSEAPAFSLDEASSTLSEDHYVLVRQLDGSEPEGTVGVTVTLVDVAGNEGSLAVGDVQLDFSPPLISGLRWELPAGKTALKSGDAHRFSGHVDEEPRSLLARIVADGRTTLVVLPAPTVVPALEGFDFSGAATLELLVDERFLQLEVVASDALGNRSDPGASRSAVVPVDLVAPEGAFAAIRGKPLTREAGVLVELAAIGATEVRLDGDLLGGGSWRPLDFSAPTAVTLSPGVGTKTLAVTFRDQAWNESAVVLDSISFDPTTDDTGPRLIDVKATSDGAVFLTFNEVLDVVSAEDPAHYELRDPGNGLLAFGAVQLASNGLRVLVETSPQTPGQTYTVRVTGVRDASSAHNLVDPAHDELTFVGFGASDTTPPTLVTPASGSAVAARAGVVRLAWSERFGAAQYTVELYRDAGLTQPVGGARVTSVPWLDATLPVGHSYHWRVRADVTAPGQFSSVGSFGLLEGAVHVYCPAAGSCGAQGLGTVEAPFQRVGDGLAFARRSGATCDVRIAGRGGGTPYRETLVVPPGARLQGGYDPGFVARDVGGNPTSITSSSIVTVQVQGARPQLPVSLDGLVLLNESTVDGFGVYAADCDSGLSIVDCSITTADGQRRSTGIYLAKSGQSMGDGPLILRTLALGGQATSASYGLAAQASAPTVIDSQLQAGAAPAESVAAKVEGGFIRLVNSVVSGCDCPGNSEAYGLRADTATSEVARSTIRGVRAAAIGAGEVSSSIIVGGAVTGGGTYVASLAVLSTTTATRISNCTVVSGGVGDTVGSYAGIRVVFVPPIVTNSVFAMRGGLGQRCVVLQHRLGASAATSFASLQNNLLTGCGTLVARVNPAGTGNCIGEPFVDCFATGANDESLMTAGGLDGTARDNLEASTVATFAAIGFADAAAGDFRLTGGTPGLVASGGKDVTGSTCGADLLQPCGGGVGDRLGASRPGADGKYSLGAYEP